MALPVPGHERVNRLCIPYTIFPVRNTHGLSMHILIFKTFSYKKKNMVFFQEKYVTHIMYKNVVGVIFLDVWHFFNKLYCMSCLLPIFILGQGKSRMVSISVCQASHPGSSLARSFCFRKVEFYQNVINLSPLGPTTGSQEAVHVLSCLCDNACERSLTTCRESTLYGILSR